MLNCLNARVLVFIVAHNAEKTIASVVHRNPRELSTLHGADILTVDDASADAPVPARALHYPVDWKDRGDRKLGCHDAPRNSCRSGRRPW
jgi:hypothetical protein